jgi:hypothetical protein
MKKVITLVPIYKPALTAMELFSLKHSLAVLQNREIALFGPVNLDRTFYQSHLGPRTFIPFDPAHFTSLQSYSQLLLDRAFYEHFVDYEFALLLQPDAIILRDELDTWCALPYDYIGAPWPDGWSVSVNVAPFAGPLAKRITFYVGNGGLSLRRIQSCIRLIERHQSVINECQKQLAIEDIVLAILGALTDGFIVPNQITASRFSMELKPSHFYAINGGYLPMGGHSWWEYEPEFWRPHLPPY